jgi:hypothetical protein
MAPQERKSMSVSAADNLAAEDAAARQESPASEEQTRAAGAMVLSEGFLDEVDQIVAETALQVVKFVQRGGE